MTTPSEANLSVGSRPTIAAEVVTETEDELRSDSSPTIGRLVSGLLRLPASQGGEIEARHRLEYEEPSIWIWRRIVGAAFAFIVMTVTWYLIKVPTGLISDEALPTQTQVAAAFNEVRADGFAGASLSAHAGISLFRLTAGLGIGSVVGVGLGLITGGAPLARTVIDPISSFFRMVPALAAAPLIVLWVGAGEAAIIGVVAFTVMWTVMGATSDARARAMRGTMTDLPLEVVSSLRAALLMAWATVIAMETVVASTGLGPMIWFAQGRTDVIVVGVYVAGLLGFVLDTSLRATWYFLINGIGARSPQQG